MKFLHIAILIIISLLVACTRPYHPPVVTPAVPENSEAEYTTDNLNFNGVMEILANSENKKIQMIFTHGMCSYNEGWAKDMGWDDYEDWAEKRSKVLTKALGVYKPGETKKLDKGKEYKGKDGRILVSTKVGTYEVPIDNEKTGTIEAHFLIWGHAIDAPRENLKYENHSEGDSKDKDEYKSPKRAYLNNFARQVINGCFIDPVVYLGRKGDDIRSRMRKAVCEVFGGTIIKGNAKKKVQCINGSNNEEPIILVSESLGSIILIDAVLTLIGGQSSCAADFSWVQSSLVEERLFNISSIFLDTNQIPLLRQANASNSFEEFWSMAQNEKVNREDCTKTHSMRVIQVVAISDPNDFFSYRMKYKHFGGDADVFELFNVLVSNADTYLGFVENPIKAHLESKSDVFSIIINGNDGLNR